MDTYTFIHILMSNIFFNRKILYSFLLKHRVNRNLCTRIKIFSEPDEEKIASSQPYPNASWVRLKSDYSILWKTLVVKNKINYSLIHILTEVCEKYITLLLCWCIRVKILKKKNPPSLIFENAKVVINTIKSKQSYCRFENLFSFN